MSLWQMGVDIDSLLLEDRTIQSRLPKTFSEDNTEKLAKAFSKLMKEGNVKSALQLLSKIQGASLSAGDVIDFGGPDTKTVLKEKHPAPGDITQEVLHGTSEKPFHPVIFEVIDSEVVRRAAHTLKDWRDHQELMLLDGGECAPPSERLLMIFATAYQVHVARRVSCEYLDPTILSSFTACRLIALDKNPGVRPIGVAAEVVLRRIISNYWAGYQRCCR